MSKKKYHIHVNATHISLASRRELMCRGLEYSRGRLYGKHDLPTAPFLSLFTHKSDDRRDLLAEKIITVVQDSKGFKGHIQSEEVVEYHRFNLKPYTGDRQIPIESISKSDGIPQAEIHVYTSRNAPKARLHQEMIISGFHRLHIHNTRIYTAQFGSELIAKETYDLLRDFFEEFGGIKEIDLERITKVVAVPVSFSMQPTIDSIVLS